MHAAGTWWSGIAPFKLQKLPTPNKIPYLLHISIAQNADEENSDSWEAVLR